MRNSHFLFLVAMLQYHFCRRIALGHLGEYAWYAHTSRDRTWPVASLKPNDYGLFDMLGNVQERCQETYRSYGVGIKGKTAEDVEDIPIVKSFVNRVNRGGSFSFTPAGVRSAVRPNNTPGTGLARHGFRPARTFR